MAAREACDFCGKLARVMDLPVKVGGQTYCGHCPITHTHAAGQSERYPEGVTHSHQGSPNVPLGELVIEGHYPTGDNHSHSTMTLMFA